MKWPILSVRAKRYIAYLQASNQKSFYANAHPLHRQLRKH
ncbi:hypothetical protein A4R44_08313 [Amycolatopsis sp. M39]|nr:hypothetical protein A4R44_08313 [Amycolatopsis sp. M39]